MSHSISNSGLQGLHNLPKFSGPFSMSQHVTASNTACREAVDTVQWQSFQMLSMRLAIVIHHVGRSWEHRDGTHGNITGFFWGDRMLYDNCMFIMWV